MVRVRLFKELADDCALEQRFVVVLECWDEAAGIEGEEGLGFVVGVDFDVFVGDFLFFEDGPDALDERAAWIVPSAFSARWYGRASDAVLTTSQSTVPTVHLSDGHRRWLWLGPSPLDGGRSRDGRPCWTSFRL